MSRKVNAILLLGSILLFINSVKHEGKFISYVQDEQYIIISYLKQAANSEPKSNNNKKDPQFLRNATISYVKKLNGETTIHAQERNNTSDTFKHSESLQPLVLRISEESNTTTTPLPDNLEQSAASSLKTSSNPRCKDANAQRRHLFQHDIPTNIGRGMNLVTLCSAFRMTVWTYGVTDFAYFPICYPRRADEIARSRILSNPQKDAHKIQPNDTIHVGYKNRAGFAKHFLPHIKSPFVLISMQTVKESDMGTQEQQNETVALLLNSPYLLHWFMNDIPRYAGGFHEHPKISPFPMGFKYGRPKVGNHRGRHYNPGPYYRRRFLWSLEMTTNHHPNNNATTTTSNKTDLIFVGMVSNTTLGREGIPSGKRLKYEAYLEEMAKSWYAISPDGDHPECHRHYEAIGLGSVPITQLHPRHYRHLNGSVIYDNQNWDLGHLYSTLPPRPTTNRNMVFDEYWMAYAENTVDRRLRWWDSMSNEPRQLEDFQLGNISEVMYANIDREFDLSSFISTPPLQCS